MNCGVFLLANVAVIAIRKPPPSKIYPKVLRTKIYAIFTEEGIIPKDKWKDLKDSINLYVRVSKGSDMRKDITDISSWSKSCVNVDYLHEGSPCE